MRRLAKQERKVGIFCNISLASLADEVFFPQFLDFLSANSDTASGLIFELGQAAYEARGSVEARNMAKLADLGFRFSIDKVTDLSLDFADLARSDVKFVKITAGVLLEQLQEMDGRPDLRSQRDIEAVDFAALALRYGVEVIAEKIESERQVVDILDLEIGYGQGPPVRRAPRDPRAGAGRERPARRLHRRAPATQGRRRGRRLLKLSLRCRLAPA